MRIVHISTSDNTGGASRAAYRWHHGLVKAGVDSIMLVSSKSLNDPTVQLASRDEGPVGLLRRQFDRWKTARDISPHAASIAKGHDLFSFDRVAEPQRLPNNLPACDLIHLHWTTWFMDWEAFLPNLPRTIPIVWTLHDMNALTGGCHYDAGCGRYLRGCGQCPALDSTSTNDLSRRIFQRKSDVLSKFANDRIHLMLPSKWIADTASVSPLLGRFRQTVIPYCLDTKKFRPIDQNACRQVLGIPENAKVVLFIADSVENTRKGFAYVLESLAQLSDVPNIFLLSIGKPSAHQIAGIPHLSLGSVSNDLLLPVVYSAADVMVMPSLQEVFGMTVFESFACGTPAVGFNTGGIPDMIRPGITGFLALPRNAGELAAAVRQVLCGSEHQQLSKQCREVAVADYSEEVQAQRCIKLYRGLIDAAVPSGVTG